MRAAHRPPVRLTMAAFRGGSLLSAILLLVGLIARLLGYGDPAVTVSTLGVVILIGTPASALVATAWELRRRRPVAAALALIVLGVLAVSVVLAVLST
jgi:hypothetical protein